MPILRLFAAAREAAGEARVEFDGATVGDVLDQARSRYGDGFAAVLERSRVWVNGQPAEMGAALAAHDVVAVLPPVSGGAGAAAPATAPAADAAAPAARAAPRPPPAPVVRLTPEVPSGPLPERAAAFEFSTPPAPSPDEATGFFEFSTPPSPRSETDDLPSFPPLPEVSAPLAGDAPREGLSHYAKFEALPASERPQSDDLLDRLADLPLFPAGDPVFGEPDDFDRPLFREPEPEPVRESEAAPAPPPPKERDWHEAVVEASPLLEEREEGDKLDEDDDDDGWDPGSGVSWSVGDPTPPPEPRPSQGGEPERDLWSWPETPHADDDEDAPRGDMESPFAPPPPPSGPSDWDKRADPSSGEASLGRPEGGRRPGGATRPPSPPPPRSAAGQPTVRVLGPDPVARPQMPAVELGDEPAVRLLGPERPSTGGTNGSGGSEGGTMTAASRAHAVGVLVDGADALLQPRRVQTPVTDLPRPPAPLGALASAPAASGGSAAPAEAPTPAPAKARPKPPPLAVVSKATRPHGRLGFLWVGITVSAVVAGPEWAGVWLAACAAVAGLQTAKVWRARNERPIQPLAGAIAAALPLCAISGVRAMTAAIVAAVVVTLLARLFSLTQAPARDVGLTLAIGVVIGLSVAAVVLLRNVNVHAPLLLLSFAAAYDAGAYLVGTGASSAWEGPAAGVASLIPVTMLSAVILVPPFTEAGPLLLGLLAALLAPCGPLAGSALLGEREANAPALRRLDSLLVMAPVWAWCAAAFVK